MQDIVVNLGVRPRQEIWFASANVCVVAIPNNGKRFWREKSYG